MGVGSLCIDVDCSPTVGGKCCMGGMAWSWAQPGDQYYRGDGPATIESLGCPCAVGCWDSDHGATKELCDLYFPPISEVQESSWVSDEEFIALRGDSGVDDWFGYGSSHPSYPNLGPGNRCYSTDVAGPGTGLSRIMSKTFLETGVPEGDVTNAIGTKTLAELRQECEQAGGGPSCEEYLQITSMRCYSNKDYITYDDGSGYFALRYVFAKSECPVTYTCVGYGGEDPVEHTSSISQEGWCVRNDVYINEACMTCPSGYTPDEPTSPAQLSLNPGNHRTCFDPTDYPVFPADEDYCSCWAKYYGPGHPNNICLQCCNQWSAGWNFMGDECVNGTWGWGGEFSGPNDFDGMGSDQGACAAFIPHWPENYCEIPYGGCGVSTLDWLGRCDFDGLCKERTSEDCDDEGGVWDDYGPCPLPGQ